MSKYILIVIIILLSITMEIRSHIAYINGYSCGKHNTRAAYAKQVISFLVDRYHWDKGTIFKYLKNNAIFEMSVENVVHPMDQYEILFDDSGNFSKNLNEREHSLFESLFSKLTENKVKCTDRHLKFGIEFKGQTYGPHGFQIKEELK